MKLRDKIKFNLFKYGYYALIYLAIGICAIINDKILEAVFLFICYLALRYLFPKTWHSNNFYLCICTSISCFWIAITFLFPINVSILFSVVFGFVIGLILYLIQDYLDLKNRFTIKKFEITKGMNKEKLKDICERFELSELETQILTYFYCDRLSLTKISYKIGYSYDNTYLLKKKALNKITKSV